MSHYLASRSDATSASSASRVRVLTSVTRVTIGQDARMTVMNDDKGCDGTTNVSRSKALSFRSVRRKESILLKRKREEGEGDTATIDKVNRA